MSKDIVRVNGPYVLKIGQPLLGQAPYKEILQQVSKVHDLTPLDLSKSVISASSILENLPRLPYFDHSEPSFEAQKIYWKLRVEMGPNKQLEQLIPALQEFGNQLIYHPNWLRYLLISRQKFPKSYDGYGLWVPYDTVKQKIKGETVEKKVIRGRMDAALSYPFWAYLKQTQNGLMTVKEQDPSVLREAEAIALLRRYSEKHFMTDPIQPISPEEIVRRQKAIGDRPFMLKAAPLVPKERESEVIADPKVARFKYKMQLIDGWDEIGGEDPTPIAPKI